MPLQTQLCSKSAFMYVLVLASSNSALILNLRSPFLKYTETVLRAIFPFTDVSDMSVTLPFLSAASPRCQEQLIYLPLKDFVQISHFFVVELCNSTPSLDEAPKFSLLCVDVATYDETPDSHPSRRF